MKLVLVAAGLVFVLGSCAPQPAPPAQHYYTQRTIYYTPKKKSTPTTYRKYGGGSSRTYSGSSDSPESFRATTR